MMSQGRRIDDYDYVQNRISMLKEVVARLRLQHHSYTDAAVEKIKQFRRLVSVYSSL